MVDMKGSGREDFGLLILRVFVGLTMVFYGSQKMFGIFGGQGYGATVHWMHSQLFVPTWLAHLSIFAEFLGGLGLIVGALTPVAAFGVACMMAVATFANMRAPGVFTGIFTGASGADPSRLFFPLSLFAASVAIMMLGPGSMSADRRLFRKAKK